ncbi:MAG TPA: hypothetical protein VGV59_04195 [Pyrinomonadaceae bacterium]|nr:hypothetical protein [Pyrinomonadaceae bacterium]
MRKKRARKLLVGLACALALTGCGDGGNGGRSNVNTNTTANANTQTGVNADAATTAGATTAGATQTPAPTAAVVATANTSGGEGESVARVVAEVASFTDELLRRIEGAQDPSTGVAEAQKFFDSRAREMRARVGAARASAQASAEARRSLLESEVDNSARVSNLQTKYLDRSMSDAAFKARLDKLVGDYRKLFEN